MSTTIDQRVVEMRFDNKNFENNVRTTMSTLERLKQRLNLTGASKGLEDINAAAKLNNMPILGSAVESVHAKFSALQVIGITTLANITNQAVNAGKRIASALTIDPIKTGFKEYETQINATQTILANTASKGSTIDDVNKALEELNKYADKTIYNFTEMTRNIGTFTAAGIDLNTSVNAIQGIANLAAVSGSTSQQASTAMYQLSQALSTGTVRLMDWNSVVNAGMGGEMFQNALKETSKLLGTGAEAAIEAKGSFRESLQEGWLTAEVLTETLKKFTTTGANEYVAKYTGLSKEAVSAALAEAEARYGEAEAIEYASKALAEKSGKNADEIKSALQFAKNAEDAATKVKTFTQLWDVLKESAQSGWSQTWKLIVGDFEQAKGLFTPLADFLTGIINGMSEARNKLIEGAMKSPFGLLAKQVNSLKENFDPMINTVNAVADSMNNLDEVVNRVIGGEFGNGQERWNKLTEAGYNWAQVQNKVNEKLGSSVKHSEKLGDAQDKLGKSQENINEQRAKTIDQLVDLEDAQLKDLGLKSSEIAALRELKKQSEKTGIPVKDLIEDMSLLEGRSLLMNSFKNAGQGLYAIFKSLGEAWTAAFPPMTSRQLYDIIAALHKFSTNLVVSDETASKLTRTFKGVFAIIGMVTDVLGGGLRIAFKAISAILGYFDMDILDVTASIGDALVKFREATNISTLFGKAVEFIVPRLSAAINKIREWANAFMELPLVQSAINKIKDAMTAIKEVDFKAIGTKALEGLMNIFDKCAGKVREWTNAFMEIPLVQDAIEKVKDAASKLKELDFKEIGTNIFDGLMNGLDWLGSQPIVEKIIEIGKNMLEGIKDVLGIHSPSTEFFEIGKNIIEGLVNGLEEHFPDAVEWVKGFAEKLKEFFGNIDWSLVLGGGIAIGAFVTISQTTDKLVNMVQTVTGPMQGVTNVLDSTSGLITQFSNSIKDVSDSFKSSMKAEVIKKIAVSIVMLIGAIIVLTYYDPAELWNAVAVVVVLAGVLIGLTFALNKMCESSNDVEDAAESFKMGSIVKALLGIAASILLLTIVIKIIGSMDPDQAKQGLLGIAVMILTIGTVLIAYSALAKTEGPQDMDKAGVMIIKLAAAMLLLVIVAKIISRMTWDEMAKAAAGIGAFVAFVAILMAISMIPSSNVDKIGLLMLEIAGAMLLMLLVAKIIASMEWSEMGKAAVGILGLIGIIALLTLTTKIAGGNLIGDVGDTLLKIAGAMFILVLTAKLIATMEWSEMGKAAIGLLGLSAIIALLIGITRLASDKDLLKLGLTVLAISAAMAILAGTAVLIGLVNVEQLKKGVIAVGVLAIIMAGLIAVTKFAQSCVGNLIVTTVAIAVMAGAVALLSFIDPGKLAGATVALAILMGMFALMVYSTKYVTQSVGALVVMTVAIGVLAGVIYLLATLPIQSTIVAASALSVLLITVSASLIILSKMHISIKDALMGVLGLTLMAIPLLAFVGILALMQNINVATTNVAALIILATAMTVLLLPLCLVGTIIGSTGGLALLGILGLLLMAVPLVAFVGILALMQNIQSATTNVTALIILATAMTALLTPLCLIGLLIGATGGIALLGVLGLLLMAVPLVAFIGILTMMEGINNATTNVGLLLVLMSAMTTMLVAIGIVGPLALIGVTALGALVLLIGAIGGLVIAIGALVQEFPMLEDFLNTGIPVLEKIAFAIGSFVGNLIAGFATGLTSGLPQIATDLSLFMAGLTPFIMGAKMIDESAITGVSNLVKMIALVTGASLLESITSFITGGSSMDSFATSITAFGDAIVAFSQKVSGNIDESGVQAAASAGKMLAEMSSSLPGTGGVIQWFCGEKDFAAFGTQLLAFGGAIVSFSKAVSADGGVNEEAIQAAANAGKIMAEMQTNLSSTGGVIQWFCGEKDFAAFGTQLLSYGKAIVTFSKLVSQEGAINETAIQAAANAGLIMTELQAAIEPTGGVLQFFTGGSGLDTFGEQLKAFGQALVDFSGIVSAEGAISDAAIQAAANAGLMMAEVQAAIPEDKWLDGKISIDDFGKQIAGFGDGLAKYGEKVSGIDLESVTNSITSANRLATLAKNVVDLDTTGIELFANVTDIASTLSTYYTTIAEIDMSAISDSLSCVTSVGKTISDLVNVDTSGVASFKKAIDNLSKVNLDGFTKTFDSSSVKLTGIGANLVESITNGVTNKKSSMTTAGNMLINSFVKGIDNKHLTVKSSMNKLISDVLKAIDSKMSKFKTTGSSLTTKLASGMLEKASKVKSVATTTVSSAVTSIKNYYDDFYDAGEYLVSGFAAGIDDNIDSAASKAAKMAKAAEKAAKEELDINSPSKVFRAIGYSVPEGFAMGIDRFTRLVRGSASNMADTAISSVSKSISRIAEAVNTDIDSQPTIRPVLDLSEVESGASAISGLFSGGATVGVNSNVGAISTMMRRRNQNGANDDVVSAIKDLHKGLDNVGNTSYQINGITYGSDTDVADAIRTLVRATIVEGRT